MRRNQGSLLWLGISILAVLSLSTALLVEASPDSERDGPVTTDWSHHHLIFSRPATAERAERVAQDPRYWQQLRRQFSASLPQVEVEDMASQLQPDSAALPPSKTQAFKPDWAEDMGTTATAGAGNYPAKFSFSAKTASCADDFVVYSTGLGVPGKAKIVAYNNIYSGCTGPVPAVYWAYDTGGQIVTSPEFGRGGTQLVFVQTSGGVASLVLLKWKASDGTLGSPVTPASLSGSSYTRCTIPCMTTLPLVHSLVAAKDSNSSAFYDYGNDAVYVGDDSGYLHEFKPVFSGTLAEVGGAWPVKLNSSAPTPLTSPVHDSVSGNVFVEDKGGYLYRVNSAGTATQSGLLDHSTALDAGPGMVQGPIVDSSAGLVYVFATSDGSAACAPAGHDCSVVYQTTTSFAANVIPANKALVGSSTVHGTAPNPLYIGAFDSSYESSTDPPTGNLYVCGDTGVAPILYRVPITAGVFGAVKPIVTPTPPADHPACAPVTDVSNPNTSVGTLERVFFSVQNNGLPTPCGAGCALSFVNTPWQAATPYNVGQEILALRGNGTPWIQVAIVAGTSGATEPGWPGVIGGTTTPPDGTVTWLTQGPTTLTPLPNWASGIRYAVHTRILDDKGNVEIVTVPGTSGGGTPNWNTTAGGLTLPDGGVTWINAGVLPSAALAASGGTSGFIIDNVVGSGTQVGASQVYFSTLGSQACTGGTGGCAVQASQAALQ